jgi:ribose transport system ATP-binding protein
VTKRSATASPPALEFRNLSKTFGGHKALAGVDFQLRHGEVHGLLGQNGSGKSTLIKILAGYHAPDPGSELYVHGAPVPLPLPAGRFRSLGISFVHQNLGLIPTLTVVENLLMGWISASNSMAVSWRRESLRARRVFASYALSIDPDTDVAKLSAVERALLAIVRAVEEIKGYEHGSAGGVLVLDEPTPFLPKHDVDQLFALVRTIVAGGASVVFVSHDVDEVLEITDRATVLRDGKLAGTIETRQASKEDLVHLIIGRALAPVGRSEGPVEVADRLVVVEDVTGPFIERLSLRIGRGEILGITGLLGSGYEQVPYLLYGGIPGVSGRLAVNGHAHDLARMRPAAAIASGIVLIPGDRVTAGVIGTLPIVDNVTMPVLDTVFNRWHLPRRRMVRIAAELGRRFEVTPNRPTLPVSALSGGNAQKIVLAKWLQAKPKLILLDEPTQGVDVGARFKVFEAIRQAAAEGAGVLCASSDYEQLASLCDRVLILSRGRIGAELSGAALSKESIAEHCYHASAAAAEAVEPVA